MVIVALLLRLHHLDEESLFMDEVYQVSFYNLPLSKIYLGAARQQQPPLDHWFGHFVYLFSQSDFAVRLPAALFGTASVALLMLLLWENTNPYLAGFISLVYALSPFHIYFSQEARPYSISIFFLLVLCLAVMRLEKKDRLSWMDFLLLMLIELLFLLSRNLSPLCVFAALNLIFFTRFLAALLRRKDVDIRRNAVYLLSAAAAFIAFFPILKVLMVTSSRYAPETPLFETLTTGLERFSYLPGFRAFIVQFEPLGYFFLVLVLAGLMLRLFNFKRVPKYDIFSIAAFLLVLSLTFELFIFQAKTELPYRPPYPIYLQPLSLIMAAYTINAIYLCYQKKGIYIVVSFFILLIMSCATCQSKKITHKTDWKKMAVTINESYDVGYLGIVETLSARKAWKPYEWGFSRYPLSVPAERITSFLDFPQILTKIKTKPFFIFFYYRDYKLLSGSKFAFIENSGGFPELESKSIVSNNVINVKHFKGMFLADLKSYSGNTIKDLYRLIKELASQLPNNNSLIDMLLLASELEHLCPELKSNSFEPMQLVAALADESDWPYIVKVRKIISNIDQDCQ